MKKAILSLALAIPLIVALPARAQPSGCDDSPENPTLVLAGLAGGVFAVSSLRSRLRARRGSRTPEDNKQ
ncbi:MAG TPA: PExPT-CTERM protein [Acidobacteriaceae bacterium]|jgi:XrtJ-associated TM-motif-TM protein|nr:PExPT-CTERM protein [Acidobacteriaceae bacterium]